MTSVANYRIDEWLSPAGIPLMPITPRYPHNYGVAVRTFETMVALDAQGARLFGPHGGCRLVLTQTGLWKRTAVCRHCWEAVWQDGTTPGRGIWMHKRRDPQNGFLGVCVGDDGKQLATRAEPASAEEIAARTAADRTAEHAVVMTS